MPTDRRSGGRRTPAARVEPHLVAERDPPGVRRRSPAIARRTVVLPAPEGPTSASVSRADVQPDAQLEGPKAGGEVGAEPAHELSTL